LSEAIEQRRQRDEGRSRVNKHRVWKIGKDRRLSVGRVAHGFDKYWWLDYRNNRTGRKLDVTIYGPASQQLRRQRDE
jgi:hypothetical protein